MEKVLPTKKSPIIGYLHHALPLSVLLSKKEYLPWFYSNYIQLYSYKDFSESSVPYNFYINDIPYRDSESGIYTSPLNNYLHSLPFLTNSINRELVHSNLDIIEFLINSVNKGYYIFLYVDEYFIENRVAFEKKRNLQQILITGYDQITEMLFTSGFDKNMMISEIKVPYNMFKKGYYSAEDHSKYRQMIYLFKPDLTEEYTFDIQLVSQQLEDYLESRDSSERLRMISTPLNNIHYGISTYISLLDYLNSLIDGKTSYDIRPIHILWEHKKCMVLRLEYLVKLGLLDKEINELYKPVEEEAQVIRYLFIKYGVKSDSSILIRIKNNIISLRNKESRILRQVVNNIKNLPVSLLNR